LSKLVVFAKFPKKGYRFSEEGPYRPYHYPWLCEKEEGKRNGKGKEKGKEKGKRKTKGKGKGKEKEKEAEKERRRKRKGKGKEKDWQWMFQNLGDPKNSAKTAGTS